MQTLWQVSTTGFTQNGWTGAVDSTAHFLNSAEPSPFVRVTGNNGFLTMSLPTKHLHVDCRCKTIFQFVSPIKILTNVSKTLIVKNQTVIDCLQLSDAKSRDDEKMTLFPKSCIFIFWVYSQKMTGWKRWVLVEKLMPFDAINIQLRKLVDICAYELPTNVQNFTQKRLTRSESIPKSYRRGYFFP